LTGSEKGPDARLARRRSEAYMKYAAATIDEA